MHNIPPVISILLSAIENVVHFISIMSAETIAANYPEIYVSKINEIKKQLTRVFDSFMSHFFMIFRSWQNNQCET